MTRILLLELGNELLEHDLPQLLAAVEVEHRGEVSVVFVELFQLERPARK